MISNKKGSNLTNPMTYVVILSMIGLMTSVLVSMGVNMSQQSQTNFDDNSISWLENERGFKISNNSMSDGILSDGQVKEQWYIDEETEGGNEKDFAIDFFFGLDWIDKVFGFLYDIYSLPTFWIRWSPLPVNDFQVVINAINFIIWFAIGGMVLYAVRGIKT